MFMGLEDPFNPSCILPKLIQVFQSKPTNWVNKNNMFIIFFFVKKKMFIILN